MAESAKQMLNLPVNLNPPRLRLRPQQEPAVYGSRPKGAIDVTDGVFWKHYAKTRVIGCLVWNRTGVAAFAKKDTTYQPLGTFADAEIASSAIRDQNPLFDPDKVVLGKKATTKKPRS